MSVPRSGTCSSSFRDGDEKSKFLCSHDERHWFVGAIPENARGVTGVTAAKFALQPEAVRELIARVKPKDQFRRRNEVYVRQGEWFFVPVSLRPEPTREQTGISEAEFARLSPEERRQGRWTRFVRDPEVYAMGSVRHPDHATIHLATWHRVLMNTEQAARAMRHVAFLD